MYVAITSPYLRDRGVTFLAMAPSIFAEKDFFRLFSDIHGYGHIFLDRIREWNWYTLVYDNSDHEAHYCPELLKLFYASIDQASIDLTTPIHDTLTYRYHYCHC